MPDQIIQIELNRVKNPNWPEANQLATMRHQIFAGSNFFAIFAVFNIRFIQVDGGFYLFSYEIKFLDWLRINSNRFTG